jgi:hypothetical protein
LPHGPASHHPSGGWMPSTVAMTPLRLEAMVFKHSLRVLVAAATSAALGATLATPARAATATAACSYQFTAWSGGFSADVTIANSGPPIEGWTVRWSVGAPTTLGGVWSATMSQPDQVHMVATNVSYNAVIPTGRSVGFGWTAAAAATSTPTDLTVNGMPC